MKKRSMSLLLVLVMVFSLLPISAMAASTLTGLSVANLEVTYVTPKNGYVTKPSGSTDSFSASAARTGSSGEGITYVYVKNTGEEATLSFNYNVTNNSYSDSYVKIALGSDDVVTHNQNVTGGNYERTLGHDDFITITVYATLSAFEYTKITLSNIVLDSGGDEPGPDDPQDEGGYDPLDKAGLFVGETLDMHQDYYVNVGTEDDPDYKLVTFTTGEVYAPATGGGNDGNYWTAISGVGYYYRPNPDTNSTMFYKVSGEKGNAPYKAYSNLLIAGKDPTKVVVVEPEKGVGVWNSGDATNTFYNADNGTQLYQVKYDTKGSTLKYNIFLYYLKNGVRQDIETGSPTHSDGLSKYGNDNPPYPHAKYWSFSHAVAAYYGQDTYADKIYRLENNQINTKLVYSPSANSDPESINNIDNVDPVNGGTVRLATYDDQYVYHGPLYQKQDAITGFSYTGADGHKVSVDLTTFLYDESTNWTDLQFYTKSADGGEGGGEGSGDDPEQPVESPEPTEPGTLISSKESTKDDLNMTKSLYMNDDGTFKIRMDAWTTGSVQKEIVDHSVPTDIILVVDLSDSMSLVQDVVVGKNADGTDKYGYRKEALLNALDAFMTKLQQEAAKHSDNPNYYRFAVVTFAGYYKFETGGWFSSGAKGGSYLFYPTNCNPDSTTNAFISGDYKTNIVTGAVTHTKGTETPDILHSALRPVNANSVAAFNSTIRPAEGEKTPFSYWKYDGTEPYQGLDYAYDILHARDGDDADRASAVILFTDGAPGTASTTSGSTGGSGAKPNCDGYKTHADPAIEKAKLIKDIDNAKVFTIGLLSYPETYHLWGEYTSQDSGYTIDRAMECISSDYKTATSLDNQGTRNTDGVEYYTRVGTTTGNISTALENALGAVMTSVVSGHTSTTVGTDAYLQDEINTSNFYLPPEFQANKVTAYWENAIDVTGGGIITWGENTFTEELDNDGNGTGKNKVVASVVQDENGENSIVQVRGFDYAKNYTAVNGDLKILGKKLVVVVDGLTPKDAGAALESNFDAGVYYNSDGAVKTAVEVESPTAVIPAKTYVMDFNRKMTLATDVEKFYDNTDENGKFDYNNKVVTYQLKNEEVLSDKTADLTFNGVDTAMAFGKFYANDHRATADQAALGENVALSWSKLNVIPASSVYFDDELQSVATAVTVGDGSGYNYSVNTSNTLDTNKVENFTFTFTGDRIDIYCTTGATKNALSVALLDVNNNDARTSFYANGNTTAATRFEVQNQYDDQDDSHELKNVPTLSIVPVNGFGKYTVKLTSTANYHLDGIRVYRPVNEKTDTAVKDAYADTNEANANYIRVRDQILTTAEAIASFKDENGNTVPGAVYVEKASMGEATTVTPTLYEKKGPKNEVYLDAGQGIGFQISPEGYAGVQMWVGLSAPSGTSASVKVSGMNESGEAAAYTYTVSSKTDMYYPIIPNVDGYVYIQNTAGGLVSVTNIKVTGDLLVPDDQGGEGTEPGQEPPVGDEGEQGNGLNSIKMYAARPMMRYIESFDTLETVDPSATPEPTEDPNAPGTPEDPNNPGDPEDPVDPGQPDEPDDPKPGWDESALNPVNMLKNIFQLILKGLGGLFGGFGKW